jgi:hypothetical protein
LSEIENCIVERRRSSFHQSKKAEIGLSQELSSIDFVIGVGGGNAPQKNGMLRATISYSIGGIAKDKIIVVVFRQG